MDQKAIDGQALRQAMRRIPSPVTVVTAAGEGEVRGITIGSFTSVSLDPPLISFNVDQAAQMHPLIMQAERFAVHVLTEAQAHLSNHFAVKDRTGAEQFAAVPYRLDAHGTPILEDVLAVFHCTRYAVYPAGDHSLILGAVYRIEEGGAAGPILYFDRSYRRIGGEAEVRSFSTVKRGSSTTP
ncbi:MAG: flavin reductase family protein [Rhodothermales bacterium]|nr:flavin reductase family protein [Rhodothermales bacterium]